MKTCVWCGVHTKKELYLRKYVIGQIGPFCSTRCESQFKHEEELKESKKEAKKSDKAARNQMDYEHSKDLEYIKLQKKLIEKEEDRERREEEKEKQRLKKLRVAELKEQQRPVQAALLQYSDFLWGFVIVYFIGTMSFAGYIHGKHKEQYGEFSEDSPVVWVWIVSGIIFLAIAGFVLKKFLPEYFRKENSEPKIKVGA